MKDAKGHGSDARGGDATRTQGGKQMFGRKPTPNERAQLGQMTKAFSAFAGEMNKSGDVGAAHQAAVNAVGQPAPAPNFRMNSYTHEIVDPQGNVAARLNLGKTRGVAVDYPPHSNDRTNSGTAGISRSSGPSIHDAVSMANYRARGTGSFPAEHIGGALHFLTGKDFAGHTVNRVTTGGKKYGHLEE